MTAPHYPLGASEPINRPRCKACGRLLDTFVVPHDVVACADVHTRIRYAANLTRVRVRDGTPVEMV